MKFKMLINVLFLAVSFTTVSSLRTEVLSEDPLYTVTWEVTPDSVDNTKDRIWLNISAETTGFVGFGISKTGGMGGADIIIGGLHSSNQSAYFSDRHATQNGFPPEDASQDWILHSASEEENFTFLQVSRLLDTCDNDDLTITEDTLKFIWSIGQDDNIQYHQENRGIFALNILAEPYPEVDLSMYQQFDAVADVIMPSKDTTYWCTVHKAPAFQGKQHAVAFGPVLLDEISKKHSHHMSLYSCKAPNGQDPQEFFQKYIDQGGIDCLQREPGQISAYPYCTPLIYTWTIGGRIMHMPENVGFPIGEEEHMFYLMETHVDNPQQVSGITFETGVRIYYTPELRPIEAGVIRIGQMYDYNFVVPPDSKDYVVVGHCSSNCTSQWIPEEGVNIFNIMLHSHAYGKQMKLRQFRNGKEEPWIINDDNYDNDYQDNRNIPLRKFLPGDQLAVECVYDTTELNPPSAVLGGFGTRREMCEAVSYYYPNVGLENCRSSILKQNIREFFRISVKELGDSLTNPEITSPQVVAGMSFLDYLNILIWAGPYRQDLQNLTLYSLHEEQCGGDGFQRNADPQETYYVTYPEIQEEYVPPTSDCSV